MGGSGLVTVTTHSSASPARNTGPRLSSATTSIMSAPGSDLGGNKAGQKSVPWQGGPPRGAGGWKRPAASTATSEGSACFGCGRRMGGGRRSGSPLPALLSVPGWSPTSLNPSPASAPFPQGSTSPPQTTTPVLWRPQPRHLARWKPGVSAHRGPRPPLPSWLGE